MMVALEFRTVVAIEKWKGRLPESMMFWLSVGWPHLAQIFTFSSLMVSEGSASI